MTNLSTELAEQNIPFSIENMDVMDTPEARDLFACLGAVVSAADDASLFRVAALPQFAIDPEDTASREFARLPRDQKHWRCLFRLGANPGRACRA